MRKTTYTLKILRGITANMQDCGLEDCEFEL